MGERKRGSDTDEYTDRERKSNRVCMGTGERETTGRQTDILTDRTMVSKSSNITWLVRAQI